MSNPGTVDSGQEMRRAADRITQGAAEVARVARNEGRHALDDVKNHAADRAEDIARAADAAAEQLEGSGQASISGYGHSLASMMRQLSGGLREGDIDDFAAELTRFARSHPAAFLAGSVALGFGMARVFRAQDVRQLMPRSNGDPFGGERAEEPARGEDDADGGLSAGRSTDNWTSRSPYGPSADFNAGGELPDANAADERPRGPYSPGGPGASSATAGGSEGGFNESLERGSAAELPESGAQCAIPQRDAQSDPRQGDVR